MEEFSELFSGLNFIRIEIIFNQWLFDCSSVYHVIRIYSNCKTRKHFKNVFINIMTFECFECTILDLIVLYFDVHQF